MNIVYVIEEGCYGRLVNLGAYFSRVEFTKDGTLYDVLLENDEFEILEDDE